MLVQATKMVDKLQVTIGDILTYTIQCINTSSLAVKELEIIDTIPGGTIYMAGSTVANVPFTGDPTTRIRLTDPLAAGQTVTINFKVRVSFGAVTSTSEGPAQNPIQNQASASYFYVQTPGQAPIRESVTTNSVSTQVNWADLAPITKKVDKATASIGDVLLYTMSFKNMGNMQANSVKVIDPPPMGTQYIEGSLIGSVTVQGTPLTTIQLVNPVAPGQSVEVSFKVKINTFPPKAIVINQATVYYNYTVDGVTIDEIEPSNPVATKLNAEAMVQILKSTNRVNVLAGDKITYTLSVSNRGNLAAVNVKIIDTLAPGTTYSNNLKINGIPSSEDITKGITLANLGVGDMTIITFDAGVTNVPVGGSIIENKAYGTYQYQSTTGGVLVTGQMESNKTVIKGYRPIILMEKQALIPVVEKGEVFTYVVDMINQGPLDAESVWVQDVLPPQLQVESIKVNGQVYSGNLATGMVLGGLKVGGNYHVEIAVRALDAMIQPFVNTIKARLDFKVESTMPPSQQEIEAVSEPIWIVKAAIEVIKSANKKEYIIGERVQYTISIKNTGNRVLSKVQMSDLVHTKLVVVEGSVKINGVAQPQEDVLKGIHIPELQVGKEVRIQFEAEIEEEGTIPNKAMVSYTYQLVEGAPVQQCERESNVLMIHANRVVLEVSKESNVMFALLEDEVVYTIRVMNTTSLEALNILLQDKISSNVELIPNSFKIDGNIVQNVDLDKGINIGILKPGQIRTIIYKVKIISGNCHGEIENGVGVTYQYILPDGTIGIYTLTPTAESVAVVILGISNFKQLSIESYLTIPEVKPDVEAINLATGSITIKSYHVIKTAVGRSMEQQKLTGYKLIVHGMLQLVIEYTALDQVQSVHSAHYNIPFSTFIVLPQDYRVGSKLQVEGKVEDVYYQLLDIRNFFQNTTALIAVKILPCEGK